MASMPNIVLQGKAKWVKCYQPNNYGKYSLDLYFDGPSLEKFKEMKVMNHLKKDEEGYYATFSRPTVRKLRTGQEQKMSPPLVVDQDNNPFNLGIGNGSTLKVELEHYSWLDNFSKQKKFACRMLKIKVVDHVPFDKQPDTDEEIAIAF